MFDFLENHGIEVLGMIIGLVYLYYEYHANKAVWVVSVIMPCISMYIYFTRGLYADFTINIYYLLIAVYGYLRWTRRDVSHAKATEAQGQESAKASPPAELPITHMPLQAYAIVIAATGALWALLWYWLSHYTDSTVPVADAFTTALSIVAMWMMARKYAEQWLAWLVVDAVCVGLYIYKGLIFYPILYAAYTVVAVFGYLKWSKMSIKP